MRTVNNFQGNSIQISDRLEVSGVRCIESRHNNSTFERNVEARWMHIPGTTFEVLLIFGPL